MQQTEVAKVLSEVLEKIVPTEDEKERMEAIARKLEQKVVAACIDYGVQAEVRVEGSVAKNTWVREEPDIDVFMRLPTSIPREQLGEVSLKIARRATEGLRQVERFAEHPYLEAFIDDTRVNIVPCYDVKQGEWLSATDRTPFHTEYIKRRLDTTLQNEVRLLKKFMKGTKVYGAEIKVGGFSGYLCELLILHYKSFVETANAFAQYRPKTVIDIENYYAGKQHDLELFFSEPLVLIDPVDKGRNVASAVQSQKLFTFVAAARAFLAKPNRKFFYPPKHSPLKVDELKRAIGNRGSSLVFLSFGAVDAVPDVFWGQLYRTRKSLRKQLEIHDFKVLRDAVWSDEKRLSIFVFELEQQILPNVKKHLGPPLQFEEECEKFLSKYAHGDSVVSGPYIEEGRWIVHLHRKFINATDLLEEKLRKGGKNIGVAELILNALEEKSEILANNEIIEKYNNNSEFAVFLTEFLSGKPFWFS